MAASDAQLWRRTVADDRDAFSELYRRHSRRLYNYTFRRLGDWSDAEDVVASVFLEAYRRRTDPAIDPDKIVAWLFGVATNLAHNHRRGRVRARRLAERTAAAVRGSSSREDAARVEAEQTMRAILGHLRTLPRDQQDVVALCIWAGLSYEEAATALSVPVGTIRSRLARARAALAELDMGSRHPVTEAKQAT